MKPSPAVHTSLFFAAALCALLASLLWFSGIHEKKIANRQLLVEEVEKKIESQLYDELNFLQGLIPTIDEALQAKNIFSLHAAIPAKKSLYITKSGKPIFASSAWLVPSDSILNLPFRSFHFLDLAGAKGFLVKLEFQAKGSGTPITLISFLPYFFKYPMDTEGFSSGHTFRAPYGRHLSYGAKGEIELSIPKLDNRVYLSLKDALPLAIPRKQLRATILYFASASAILILCSAYFFVWFLLNKGSKGLGFGGLLLVFLSSFIIHYVIDRSGYLPDFWLYDAAKYASKQVIPSFFAWFLLVLGCFFSACMVGSLSLSNSKGWWLLILYSSLFGITLVYGWLYQSIQVDSQFDLSLNHLIHYGEQEIIILASILLLLYSLFLTLSTCLNFISAFSLKRRVAIGAVVVGLASGLSLFLEAFLAPTSALVLLYLFSMLGSKKPMPLFSANRIIITAMLGAFLLLDGFVEKRSLQPSDRSIPSRIAQVASATYEVDRFLENVSKDENPSPASIEKEFQARQKNTSLFLVKLQMEDITQKDKALAIKDTFLGELPLHFSFRNASENPFLWQVFGQTTEHQHASQLAYPLGKTFPIAPLTAVESLMKQGLKNPYTKHWPVFFFYFAFALAGLLIGNFAYGLLSRRMYQSFAFRVNQYFLVTLIVPVVVVLIAFVWNAKIEIAEDLQLGVLSSAQMPAAASSLAGLKEEIIEEFYYQEFFPGQEKYCSNPIVTERYANNLRYLVAFQPEGNEVSVRTNYGYQEQLWRELSESISVGLVFVSLLFVSLLVFGEYVSNLLTRPIVSLSSNLSETDLQKSTPWYWSSDDEFGVLSKSYNAMLRRLESDRKQIAKQQQELAWKEMARQVAHEIKNPLTPMKLTIQFLNRLGQKGEISQETLNQKLKTLEVQIDTLAEIATNFSSFAQMPDPEEEEFILNDVVEQTVALYEDNEEITIQKFITKENLKVKADRKFMGRVITNLVLNGIQAVEPPTKPHIVIQLKSQENTALLTVKDNGGGIPDAFRDKVFKPKFSTKYAGSGIGLSVAKDAIEYAGGKIWFEDNPESGTCFLIQLPLSSKKP